MQINIFKIPKLILSDILMLIPLVELLFRICVLGQSKEEIDSNVSKISQFLIDKASQLDEDYNK